MMILLLHKPYTTSSKFLKFFKLLDRRGALFFLNLLSRWIEQVTPKLPDPDWFMKGGLDDQETDSNN